MTGPRIRVPEPIDGPRPLPHNSAPCKHAPVAQLDRVPGYEPGGREFESLRARHFKGPSTCRRSFFLVLLPIEWCRIRPGRMRRSPPASGESRGSAGNTTPRRTSLQGDFVRADRVCVEPGCTAPACWSRTRNHAADEIPLQRRPRPKSFTAAEWLLTRGFYPILQWWIPAPHSIGRRSTKKPPSGGISVSGGVRGIRTLDRAFDPILP